MASLNRNESLKKAKTTSITKVEGPLDIVDYDFEDAKKKGYDLLTGELMDRAGVAAAAGGTEQSYYKRMYPDLRLD
jgi:hypothetical protein